MSVCFILRVSHFFNCVLTVTVCCRNFEKIMQYDRVLYFVKLNR